VPAAALAAEGTPISHVIIARIWHRFGVQPWRTLTFRFFPDPQLKGQIREVVGVYPHPLERAVMLCVDARIPQLSGCSGRRICGLSCVNGARPGDRACH
jgi:hypothetical protein